jgi:WD40 repeat protein
MVKYMFQINYVGFLSWRIVTGQRPVDSPALRSNAPHPHPQKPQHLKHGQPCDNANMNKLHVSLLLATILALLSACAPQANALPPTAAPTQSITNTAIPPTAIPPSPTPAPITISSGTVDQLVEYQTFSSQDELIRTLAFSPDGSTLASAGGNSYDFIIRVWDVTNRQFLRTLEGHTGIVWMLAFSPDGELLASASSDGSVRVWDWKRGTLMRTLSFPHEMVSVGFSPDGSTLAAGGVFEWPDAAIWMYSVSDLQEQMKVFEFWNIPDLAYTPDGQLLVGGGTSRNVGVWRASDGAMEFTLPHAGQVTSLDISSDGGTLATGLCEEADASLNCTRGAVWFWDLQTGKNYNALSDFSDWVDAVEYSPDGSVLFVGSRDGIVRAYGTADFSVLREFNVALDHGVFAISANGGYLATLGDGETIHIWTAAQ